MPRGAITASLLAKCKPRIVALMSINMLINRKLEMLEKKKKTHVMILAGLKIFTEVVSLLRKTQTMS